jgi:type II secretory ATPase GspE/PulE/Tfp pilus assembly ATPase PilB-like protein
VGELDKPIGQVLRELEFVTEPQVQEALAVQRKLGGVVGEILVELGYASHEEVLRALAAQTGLEIDLEQVPREDVKRTFRWLKGDKVRFDLAERRVESSDTPADDDLVVKLVDLLLTTALDVDATEIHFELLTDGFRIRHRVDGAFYEMDAPSRRLAPPLLGRLRRITGLTADRPRNTLKAVFAGRIFRSEAAWIRAVDQESIVLRFQPV